MNITNSMYPITTGFNTITDMKAQFDKLQTQLATGQKATTLAEMGNSRLISLSLSSRISAIEGYQGSVDTLGVRFSVMNQALTQMGSIQSDTRTSSTVGDYGTNDINFTTQPQQARSNLDLVFNLLNSQENGRYLFAGNDTGDAPVADTDKILNGDPSRDLAGFTQVAAERLQADQGTGQMGRLITTPPPGDTVTLAEDGSHPFGLKLGTLSATGSAVALTPAGGSPASEAIQFTGLPSAGDTVTMGFGLPDGSTTSITLKAVTGTPGSGEYQIGVTPNQTAANFQAALASQIQATAKTDLAVASKVAAATDFFNGQGQQPMRVDGPPFATATALRPASASDTVLWYTGQNSADSSAARQSVTAKVGDSTTIAYGVQGTESGLVSLVRSLAVMADSTFSVTDPTSKGRYDATMSRQLDALSAAHDTDAGSIKSIAVGLGLAQGTAKAETDRQAIYKTQLQGIQSDIEGISNEEVTMRILALQTRLQASYQTTSLVSQLSLVNYLK